MDSCLILTPVTTPVAPAAGPRHRVPGPTLPDRPLLQGPPLSCLFSPFPLLPPPLELPQTRMLVTASSSTPCPQSLPLKSVLTQTPAFYCSQPKVVHCSAPTTDSSPLGPHLADPSPVPPSLFTLQALLWGPLRVLRPLETWRA